MTAEQPLLIPAQVRQWHESRVRQWQDRIAEITAAMQDMQDELNILTRYVEAAKVFMANTPESNGETIIDSTPPPPPEPNGQEAGDILMATLKSLGGKAKPGTIKERLASQAPVGSYAEKLVGSPYFYTALMRLAKTDRLGKDGNYYVLPQSSAQAETGVGAPGSL